MYNQKSKQLLQAKCVKMGVSTSHSISKAHTSVKNDYNRNYLQKKNKKSYIYFVIESQQTICRHSQNLRFNRKLKKKNTPHFYIKYHFSYLFEIFQRNHFFLKQTNQKLCYLKRHLNVEKYSHILFLEFHGIINFLER